MNTLSYGGFLICTALILFIQAESWGADQVSAELYQKNSKQQVLALKISSPAPGSLIAQISFPASLQIVATDPAVAKLDQESGAVKWLIKKPRPGTILLTLKTAAPADLSKLSADVMYRSGAGGSLKKISAKKR